MKAKIISLLFAFGIILLMALYFLINPSYEKSLEAKYYFETGDYTKAYELANQAFSMDLYNRMASTIMVQSQTSMKYQKYINQAKKYLDEINKLVSKDTLSDADRAKIKMMSEIMVDSYVKLAPSVITNKALVEEASSYYKNFEKILEKITR
jgi:tetratricopeptide (TPR) repeat protein